LKNDFLPSDAHYTLLNWLKRSIYCGQSAPF
jgi:hypothetical protein